MTTETASRLQKLHSVVGGGRRLRSLRGRLGLTMRDVEDGSGKIAERHGNTEYLIPPSRLSDIETKGIVPSIYRFYSLSVVYREDLRDLLTFYEVDLNQVAGDLDVSMPAKSHVSAAVSAVSSVRIPIRLDPGFDTRKTSHFSRMVEKWGTVPLSYLDQFQKHDYTYGYIGTDDFTMYPILPPGTFVQIDESRNQVAQGRWKSEYERPIYFVETRAGHICCWCTLSREEIILQPHPLSPVPAKVFRYPHQAEVLGQVVGCAMSLGEWSATEDDATEGAGKSTLVVDDAATVYPATNGDRSIRKAS